MTPPVRGRRGRRGPGRHGDRPPPRGPGPPLRDAGRRRVHRRHLAVALGLPGAVHAAPVRRPARAGVPGRARRPPVARRGGRVPRAVRVRTFELPIELDSRVRSLTAADGGFVLELDGRALEADQVVVATGPFQAPHVPELAGGLGPEVVQRHAADYRGPREIPDGTVLVVGGGNSGFQIAEELAGATRSTCRRVPAGRAPPARSGTGPLLVPGGHRADGQVDGDADGPPHEGARRPRRIEPAGDPPARGDAPPAGGHRLGAHGRLRRRRATSRSMP